MEDDEASPQRLSKRLATRESREPCGICLQLSHAEFGLPGGMPCCSARFHKGCLAQWRLQQGKEVGGQPTRNTQAILAASELSSRLTWHDFEKSRSRTLHRSASLNDQA